MANSFNDLHSLNFAKIMIKKANKKVVKTTTLSATMAVSKGETGLDLVQVLPDNPCIGQVDSFRGLGYGQMLSTGSFEFVRHQIPHSKAEMLLRLPHCTTSKCKDRTHRLTFIVKDNELENFCRYLLEEVPQVVTFMDKYVEKMKKYKNEKMKNVEVA